MRLPLFLLTVLTVCMLFIACEPFLIYEDQIPEFNAPPDKALCVIYRASGIYNNLAQIWYDKKLVSGTTGNTITSFDVEPGEHYIFSKINIMNKVKFNFQPGRTYYIAQAAFPIPIGITTLISATLSPRTCEEALEKLESEKGKLKYTRFNPNYEGAEDLSDKDFQDEVEDYKKWSEKEPEKAKLEAEYAGCE